MVEVMYRHPVDPLTPAYDRQLKEIFALGRDKYANRLFSFIRNKGESNPPHLFDDRIVVMGPGMDRIRTSSTGMVVYDHHNVGYWEEETEVSPVYDQVFTPTVELCEELKDKRLEWLRERGRNG